MLHTNFCSPSPSLYFLLLIVWDHSLYLIKYAHNNNATLNTWFISYMCMCVLQSLNQDDEHITSHNVKQMLFN